MTRDRLERLDRMTSIYLTVYLNECPMCVSSTGRSSAGAIYRRSSRSITLRCPECGLQWTMTYVKIHQAARRMAQNPKVHEGERKGLAHLADMTEFALARETRGRRKTADA